MPDQPGQRSHRRWIARRGGLREPVERAGSRTGALPCHWPTIRSQRSVLGRAAPRPGHAGERKRSDRGSRRLGGVHATTSGVVSRNGAPCCARGEPSATGAAGRAFSPIGPGRSQRCRRGRPGRCRTRRASPGRPPAARDARHPTGRAGPESPRPPGDRWCSAGTTRGSRRRRRRAGRQSRRRARPGLTAITSTTTSRTAAAVPSVTHVSRPRTSPTTTRITVAGNAAQPAHGRPVAAAAR